MKIYNNIKDDMKNKDTFFCSRYFNSTIIENNFSKTLNL